MACSKIWTTRRRLNTWPKSTITCVKKCSKRKSTPKRFDRFVKTTMQGARFLRLKVSLYKLECLNLYSTVQVLTEKILTTGECTNSNHTTYMKTKCAPACMSCGSFFWFNRIKFSIIGVRDHIMVKVLDKYKDITGTRQRTISVESASDEFVKKPQVLQFEDPEAFDQYMG
jgi:hypothetical protein